MGHHIAETQKKAIGIMGKLMGLMPNCRGPAQKTRRILAARRCTPSYSTPPPHGVRRCRSNATERKSVVSRGKVNIRVMQAYRTALSAALEECPDIPRGQIPRKGHKRRHPPQMAGPLDQREPRRMDALADPRYPAMDKEDFGETDYLTYEFLTGHGNFGTYLKRIGKAETDRCTHCREEDGPGHALLACPRWEEKRRAVERSLGVKLTTGNIVDTMLQKE
ncbi:hypothetical protein NQ318_019069 [Aromia moschata]|uniref:Reverse transcriptase n=1 Tax=Aromia moschata TaxID=1265417 RepID=A0AAV8Y6F8_9CUCU|nr:hypothetical protein NQ318_019069 [Aromia moschata]